MGLGREIAGDLLTVRGVSLSRGGKQVLKAIDCTLNDRDRTLVIGPNGAGKTLFLQVCHGIVRPDAGTVEWTAGNPLDPALRHRTPQAMVFQRPVLLRRSVAQNVDFSLKLRGFARAERRERTAEVLARTGLSRHADRPARALSFGEQQRLALARAVATEPRVLFLDEPTANLDPAAAYLVEGIVTEMSASGVKVVMTSHDLNQARRLAEEVIFLYRGRIKEQAPAARFFAEPGNDLARAFLKGDLLWWRRRSIFDADRCQ